MLSHGDKKQVKAREGASRPTTCPLLDVRGAGAASRLQLPPSTTFLNGPIVSSESNLALDPMTTVLDMEAIASKTREHAMARTNSSINIKTIPSSPLSVALSFFPKHQELSATSTTAAPISAESAPALSIKERPTVLRIRARSVPATRAERASSRLNDGPLGTIKSSETHGSYASDITGTFENRVSPTHLHGLMYRYFNDTVTSPPSPETIHTRRLPPRVPAFKDSTRRPAPISTSPLLLLLQRLTPTPQSTTTTTTTTTTPTPKQTPEAGPRSFMAALAHNRPLTSHRWSNASTVVTSLVSVQEQQRAADQKTTAIIDQIQQGRNAAAQRKADYEKDPHSRDIMARLQSGLQQRIEARMKGISADGIVTALTASPISLTKYNRKQSLLSIPRKGSAKWETQKKRGRRQVRRRMRCTYSTTLPPNRQDRVPTRILPRRTASDRITYTDRQLLDVRTGLRETEAQRVVNIQSTNGPKRALATCIATVNNYQPLLNVRTGLRETEAQRVVNIQSINGLKRTLPRRMPSGRATCIATVNNEEQFTIRTRLVSETEAQRDVNGPKRTLPRRMPSGRATCIATVNNQRLYNERTGLRETEAQRDVNGLKRTLGTCIATVNKGQFNIRTGLVSETEAQRDVNGLKRTLPRRMPSGRATCIATVNNKEQFTMRTGLDSETQAQRDANLLLSRHNHEQSNTRTGLRETEAQRDDVASPPPETEGATVQSYSWRHATRRTRVKHTRARNRILASQARIIKEKLTPIIARPSSKGRPMKLPTPSAAKLAVAPYTRHPVKSGRATSELGSTNANHQLVTEAIITEECQAISYAEDLVLSHPYSNYICMSRTNAVLLYRTRESRYINLPPISRGIGPEGASSIKVSARARRKAIGNLTSRNGRPAGWIEDKDDGGIKNWLIGRVYNLGSPMSWSKTALPFSPPPLPKIVNTLHFRRDEILDACKKLGIRYDKNIRRILYHDNATSSMMTPVPSICNSLYSTIHYQQLFDPDQSRDTRDSSLPPRGTEHWRPWPKALPLEPKQSWRLAAFPTLLGFHETKYFSINKQRMADYDPSTPLTHLERQLPDWHALHVEDNGVLRPVRTQGDMMQLGCTMHNGKPINLLTQYCRTTVDSLIRQTILQWGYFYDPVNPHDRHNEVWYRRPWRDMERKLNKRGRYIRPWETCTKHDVTSLEILGGSDRTTTSEEWTSTFAEGNMARRKAMALIMRQQSARTELTVRRTLSRQFEEIDIPEFALLDQSAEYTELPHTLKELHAGLHSIEVLAGRKAFPLDHHGTMERFHFDTLSRSRQVQYLMTKLDGIRATYDQANNEDIEELRLSLNERYPDYIQAIHRDTFKGMTTIGIPKQRDGQQSLGQIIAIAMIAHRDCCFRLLSPGDHAALHIALLYQESQPVSLHPGEILRCRDMGLTDEIEGMHHKSVISLIRDTTHLMKDQYIFLRELYDGWAFANTNMLRLDEHNAQRACDRQVLSRKVTPRRFTPRITFSHPTAWHTLLNKMCVTLRTTGLPKRALRLYNILALLSDTRYTDTRKEIIVQQHEFYYNVLEQVPQEAREAYLVGMYDRIIARGEISDRQYIDGPYLKTASLSSEPFDSETQALLIKRQKDKDKREIIVAHSCSFYRELTPREQSLISFSNLPLTDRWRDLIIRGEDRRTNRTESEDAILDIIQEELISSNYTAKLQGYDSAIHKEKCDDQSNFGWGRVPMSERNKKLADQSATRWPRYVNSPPRVKLYPTSDVQNEEELLQRRLNIGNPRSMYGRPEGWIEDVQIWKDIKHEVNRGPGMYQDSILTQRRTRRHDGRSYRAATVKTYGRLQLNHHTATASYELSTVTPAPCRTMSPPTFHLHPPSGAHAYEPHRIALVHTSNSYITVNGPNDHHHVGIDGTINTDANNNTVTGPNDRHHVGIDTHTNANHNRIAVIGLNDHHHVSTDAAININIHNAAVTGPNDRHHVGIDTSHNINQDSVRRSLLIRISHPDNGDVNIHQVDKPMCATRLVTIRPAIEFIIRRRNHQPETSNRIIQENTRPPIMCRMLRREAIPFEMDGEPHVIKHDSPSPTPPPPAQEYRAPTPKPLLKRNPPAYSRFSRPVTRTPPGRRSRLLARMVHTDSSHSPRQEFRSRRQPIGRQYQQPLLDNTLAEQQKLKLWQQQRDLYQQLKEQYQQMQQPLQHCEQFVQQLQHYQLQQQQHQQFHQQQPLPYYALYSPVVQQCQLQPQPSPSPRQSLQSQSLSPPSPRQQYQSRRQSAPQQLYQPPHLRPLPSPRQQHLLQSPLHYQPSTPQIQHRQRQVDTQTQTPHTDICRECCRRHTWSMCPRNADQQILNHLPEAERHKGSGPHPRADPSDIKTIIAQYGRVGHFDLACGDTQYQSRSLHSAKTGDQEIRMPCTIQRSIDVQLLVDTGSHVNIISRQWYEKNKRLLGPMEPVPKYAIFMGTSNRAEAAGTLDLAVTLFDGGSVVEFTKMINFTVVNEFMTEVMGGMDLIQQFFVSLNFVNCRMTFRDDLIPDSDFILAATTHQSLTTESSSAPSTPSLLPFTQGTSTSPSKRRRASSVQHTLARLPKSTQGYDKRVIHRDEHEEHKNQQGQSHGRQKRKRNHNAHSDTFDAQPRPSQPRIISLRRTTSIDMTSLIRTTPIEPTSLQRTTSIEMTPLQCTTPIELASPIMTGQHQYRIHIDNDWTPQLLDQIEHDQDESQKDESAIRSPTFIEPSDEQSKTEDKGRLTIQIDNDASAPMDISSPMSLCMAGMKGIDISGNHRSDTPTPPTTNRSSTKSSRRRQKQMANIVEQ